MSADNGGGVPIASLFKQRDGQTGKVKGGNSNCNPVEQAKVMAGS